MMDRSEKTRLREYIGGHLDLSATRLSDHQAQRLADFIDGYDAYRGQSFERSSSHRGWGSDGRYVRHETTVDTFTGTVGILREYSFRDDDGQEGRSTQNITTARGILDWLDAHG
jgi:sucrose-6-phosphate hydrolase SacC (GH32 family)